MKGQMLHDSSYEGCEYINREKVEWWAGVGESWELLLNGYGTLSGRWKSFGYGWW